MSARNTQVEIARAKLIAGMIVLAVMAASCAPQVVARAVAAPAAATATR